QVMSWYTFTPDADAHRQAPHLWDSLGNPGAVEILVGNRHHALSRLAAKGWHAVCILRIEQVACLSIGRRPVPERLVALRAHVESPRAITGLHGLVGCGLDDLTLVQRRACGIVDSRGNLHRGAHSHVAAILRWGSENPRLRADHHVAHTA